MISPCYRLEVYESNPFEALEPEVESGGANESQTCFLLYEKTLQS